MKENLNTYLQKNVKDFNALSSKQQKFQIRELAVYQLVDQNASIPLWDEAFEKLHVLAQETSQKTVAHKVIAESLVEIRTLINRVPKDQLPIPLEVAEELPTGVRTRVFYAYIHKKSCHNLYPVTTTLISIDGAHYLGVENGGLNTVYNVGDMPTELHGVVTLGELVVTEPISSLRSFGPSLRKKFYNGIGIYKRGVAPGRAHETASRNEKLMWERQRNINQQLGHLFVRVKQLDPNDENFFSETRAILEDAMEVDSMDGSVMGTNIRLISNLAWTVGGPPAGFANVVRASQRAVQQNVPFTNNAAGWAYLEGYYQGAVQYARLCVNVYVGRLACRALTINATTTLTQNVVVFPFFIYTLNQFNDNLINKR